VVDEDEVRHQLAAGVVGHQDDIGRVRQRGQQAGAVVGHQAGLLGISGPVDAEPQVGAVSPQRGQQHIRTALTSHGGQGGLCGLVVELRRLEVRERVDPVPRS
jgi:hypothetical protein